jgi:hypothetical protein
MVLTLPDALIGWVLGLPQRVATSTFSWGIEIMDWTIFASCDLEKAIDDQVEWKLWFNSTRTCRAAVPHQTGQG